MSPIEDEEHCWPCGGPRQAGRVSPDRQPPLLGLSLAVLSPLVSSGLVTTLPETLHAHLIDSVGLGWGRGGEWESVLSHSPYPGTGA